MYIFLSDSGKETANLLSEESIWNNITKFKEGCVSD